MADTGETEQGNAASVGRDDTSGVGQNKIFRLETPHAHTDSLLSASKFNCQRQPIYFHYHKTGLFDGLELFKRIT